MGRGDGIGDYEVGFAKVLLNCLKCPVEVLGKQLASWIGAEEGVDWRYYLRKHLRADGARNHGSR